MAGDDDEMVGDVDSFQDEADEHDESDDELVTSLDSGDKDADPYSEAGREKLKDDDEAKPGEIGFAKGPSRSKKRR